MNICRNIWTHQYFGYSLKFLPVCWNFYENKWKVKKKKKTQKQPVSEMLKVPNLEVHSTETHMKPLSCAARDGQRVKSSNSCCRMLAPMNQLSVKQPEPPVMGQSRYEGLSNFLREAAMLSNYSTEAMPFRKQRSAFCF